MNITHMVAVIHVDDHDAAVDWYTLLFGREPDRRPMEPSAEWELGDGRGIQVYRDPDRAGGHDVIVGVDDVDSALAELATRGITGEAYTVPSGQFRLAELTDPAGNTVVLAHEPAA